MNIHVRTPRGIEAFPEVEQKRYMHILVRMMLEMPRTRAERIEAAHWYSRFVVEDREGLEAVI